MAKLVSTENNDVVYFIMTYLLLNREKTNIFNFTQSKIPIK